MTRPNGILRKKLAHWIGFCHVTLVKADVKIKQIDNPGGNKYEVEVIINVPDKVITAKDSTMNVLAAVDIVETKLNGQLRRYKDDTLAHVGRSRGVLAKFKRSFRRG